MNWRQRWQRLRLRFVYAIGALCYWTLDALALWRQRPNPQPGRVAVVFPDFLGDVVMWLPYGQALCAHLQQEGRSVVVICDASSQPLMQAALSGCEVVGISSAALRLSQPRQRAQALRRLRALQVEQTLYMSHPRWTMRRGEGLVQALGAPAIGFDHCMRDRPNWEVRWSNRRYARLVPSDGRIEVHVQRRFASYLNFLGLASEAAQPLHWPPSVRRWSDGPYWILAAGAGQPYRCWPAERFAEVARNLAVRYPHWRCLLIGTADERDLAQTIAEALGPSALNLAGQTSVLELIDLIAQAQLLIGNDSAAGHIAAAVGTPAVVIVGGGHWGRCFPYDPASAPVRRLPLAVGHRMPCFGCDWICAYGGRRDRPFPCIEGVTVEEVCKAVERALASSLSPHDRGGALPAKITADQGGEAAAAECAQYGAHRQT